MADALVCIGQLVRPAEPLIGVASMVVTFPLGGDMGMMGEVMEGAVGLGRARGLLASPKMVKHHIFNEFRGNSSATAKYRDFFTKHGIDVDDFAVELTEGTHQRLIHGKGQNWTAVWKKWIDENPSATTKEVYQQAGRMMDDYGLSGLRIGPYR